MRRLAPAIAAVLAAFPGCSPSEQPPEAVEQIRGAVDIVGGNRYDKGSYVDGGRTIFSFRIRVTNQGDATGRAPHPECYVVVRDERHELQIYENPELAPGEHGWFRTGGPVPRLGPRETDNVEPRCDF